ncbi:hypothetical protein R5R35_012803 [Gryllus longicercus]|uniref:Uncharacterized protein n=1 Tax=Gryllus longicercus TaxID=2509291 RepID=A0AAN9VJN8_9ORTH
MMASSSSRVEVDTTDRSSAKRRKITHNEEICNELLEWEQMEADVDHVDKIIIPASQSIENNDAGAHIPTTTAQMVPTEIISLLRDLRSYFSEHI